MTFELTYFWFNIFEGFFWIALSLTCLWAFFRYRKTAFEKLALFTSINLFIFGVSDFVEIQTDGFIGHHTWLFFWKSACVLGLAYSFYYYIRLRKRGESLKQ